MKHRIIPAILSGGAGTRLWPASTPAKPKQFHALASADSLLADTLARVRGETGALSFAAPIVIANAGHAKLVAEQAGADTTVVLEPCARNTAAAAAVAAAVALERETTALVLLLPADHVVADRTAFLAAIARAAPFAEDRIVTFGMTPTRAETGYGYIKPGAELGAGVSVIEAFKEKPVAALAREYLADGHLWNAGMFLFSPTLLLREFDGHPEIRTHAIAALARAVRSGNEIRLDETAFADAPALPLDIAVMEHTSFGAVVPCEIGWTDVGAWDEIWRLAARDEAGNALHGAVVALDARNNLLRSEGPKICIAGIDDLIVVATGDTVLIVPRARAQDVKPLKEMAEKLKP